MARTVRLSPLLEEHSRALGVDLGYFVVVFAAVVFSTGSDVRGAAAFALIGSVAVFHWLQMRFLVKLRFDDEAVTIVRVLRRTRVRWADLAGLIYTEYGSSTPNSPTSYRLRLVLRGQEPPVGRYLTQVQRQDYGRGPLVMALATLDDDGETKGDHRRRQVLAELERHGFPPPAPRPWEFRTPRFSAKALTAAAAMDLRGTHAVAVRHGTDVTEAERPLLERTLPGLAEEHGGADTRLEEPDFTSYFFEGQGAAQGAAAFLAQARAAVPPHWQVSPGTLPEDPDLDTAPSTPPETPAPAGTPAPPAPPRTPAPPTPPRTPAPPAASEESAGPEPT
jgi:hypothetical protein